MGSLLGGLGQAVAGEAAGTGEGERGADRAQEQGEFPAAFMVPKALAGVAGVDVDHRRHDQGAGRWGGEAEREQQPAAELGQPGEEGEEAAGPVAQPFEVAAGAGEAVAAEQAEQLLGAVTGEQQADDESEREQSEIHGGSSRWRRVLIVARATILRADRRTMLLRCQLLCRRLLG